MNVKTTVALVVLLVAIGAYLFFVQRDAPLSGNDVNDTSTAKRGEPLLPTDFPSPTKGATLTIERDSKTAAYELTDDGWYQTQPVRVAMNAGAMERLVGDVLQLRYTQTLSPGTADAPSLADAKLDPPLGMVTYAMGSDTAIVRVGRKLLGGFGYVALDDNDLIYVVGDRLYNGLIEADTDQWRKRTLDLPPAAQIDAVTVARVEGDPIAMHRTDGRWYLDIDAHQRADASAVDALTAALGKVTIEKFVADGPPTEGLSLYGLDKPSLTVTVHEAATDTTKLLRVGGPTDLGETSVFATWGETSRENASASETSKGVPALRKASEMGVVVFSMARSAVEPFDVQVGVLRDPRLFDIEALAVRQITVEREDLPTLRLERDTAGLKFIDPKPDFDADRDAATKLIADVAGMTTETFVPDFEPTGEPMASVELLRRGTGQESAKVYHDGERYVAQRDGEAVGFVLSDEQAERLRTPLLALRDRVIATIPADVIDRLTLTHGDKTRAFVRNGDVFTSEGEDKADLGRIGALVAVLNPLYAESWASPTSTPGSASTTASESTKSGIALVTWEVTTTTDTLSLSVDPSTRHATLTGINEPFVLPQETVDLLTGDMADRSLLSAAPEDIAAIRVEQAGHHFTMRRRPDGGIIADKADQLPTVDQDMATRLFDAVAGLETDDSFDTSAIEPDMDRAVLGLTITTADDATRKLDLWTQDNRMFGRVDGQEQIVAFTDASARALAFLFAQPPATQ